MGDEPTGLILTAVLILLGMIFLVALVLDLRSSKRAKDELRSRLGDPLPADNRDQQSAEATGSL